MTEAPTPTTTHDIYHHTRTAIMQDLCKMMAEDPQLAYDLRTCATVFDNAARKFEDVREVDAFEKEAARLRQRAEIVRKLAHTLGEIGTLERLKTRIEEVRDA